MYDGKLAYVPALEDVLVWDVKKGQMVSGMQLWTLAKAHALFSCLCGMKQVIERKLHALFVLLRKTHSQSAMLTDRYDYGTSHPRP